MMGLPPKGPDGFIHIHGIQHAREVLGRLAHHGEITPEQQRWIHNDLYNNALSNWIQVEMVLVPVGKYYEVRLKANGEERGYPVNPPSWWTRLKNWLA